MFAGGEKPREDWRIGTEHEKFVYRLRRPSRAELGRARRHPRPADRPDRIWLAAGRGRRQGHRADRRRRHHQPGTRRASSSCRARRSQDLHQSCAESGRHLEQVKAVGDRLGLGFLGLGMWPDKARADLPIMPKGRYEIMLRHMPRVGNLGLDMMLRTCTIQVNLDYASEADMVKKFRVGLALQPVATALFANSPFTEGKPNGYKSFRSHIWEDTDPAPTGMLPFVFEDGFGYERYCDYALDVPMYFVFRDGEYIDAAGQSFRDFLDGKLPALPGEKPTHRRLDRPSVDRLSRSAAEELPRNARRRRRTLGPDLRPARPVGRAALFETARSMRRGTGSSIGRSRSARRFAMRSRARRSTRRCPAAAPFATLPQRCSRSPRRA